MVESAASPASFAPVLRHSELLGIATASTLHQPAGDGLVALSGDEFGWQHALGVVWRQNGLSPLAREFRDEAQAWCAGRTF